MAKPPEQPALQAPADAKAHRPWFIACAALLVVGLAATALAMLADRYALMHWRDIDRSAEIKDWYKALRVLGYAPVWLVIAVALMLIDSGRKLTDRPGSAMATFTRGPFVIASAALGGGIAELLKILIGRGRPPAIVTDSTPLYTWPDWAMRTLNTSDLGLPSSHASTAFGGMVALAILFPRAGVVFIACAIGTGITRVLSGNHFLSDAIAGAFVGAIMPVLITALVRRKRGGTR